MAQHPLRAGPPAVPTVAQQQPTRAPQRALRPRPAPTAPVRAPARTPRRNPFARLGRALQIIGLPTGPEGLAAEQRIVERGLAVEERNLTAAQSQALTQLKAQARTDPVGASQRLDEFLSTSQLTTGALETLADVQESIGVQAAARQIVENLPPASRKAQILRDAASKPGFDAQVLEGLMQVLPVIPDPIRTNVPGVGFVEIDPVTDKSKLLVAEPFKAQFEETKAFREMVDLKQRFNLSVESPIMQSLQQRITRVRRGKALTDVQKSQQAIEDATFLYGARSGQVVQLQKELDGLLNPAVQAKASDILTLGSKFASESKTFATQTSGYAKILALSKLPKGTGFSDVALVFAFMKLQDPDSVVREGEFATAEDTVGVTQKFVRMYNRAREGVRLTPDQRKDLFNTSKTLFAEARERHLGIEKSFRDLSRSMGQDPKIVLRDYVGKFRDNLEPQLALDTARIVKQFQEKASRNAVEGTIFSKDFEFEGMR